jgi:HSP20 family protein
LVGGGTGDGSGAGIEGVGGFGFGSGRGGLMVLIRTCAVDCKTLSSSIARRRRHRSCFDFFGYLSIKRGGVPMAQRESTLSTNRPETRSTSRGQLSRWNPFEAFDTELDRMFNDFGFGRSLFGPRGWRRGQAAESWVPDVDVFQRGDELVIKADLPGMNKEDITVDLTDDRVTIQGERKSEHEEERAGVFRSERSYGSFSRVVPLPTGAIADNAKAAFRDGVLEITMPSPPAQVSRGRRLDIADSSQQQKK